jgi:hypothetical protein
MAPATEAKTERHKNAALFQDHPTSCATVGAESHAHADLTRLETTDDVPPGAAACTLFVMLDGLWCPHR